MNKMFKKTTIFILIVLLAQLLLTGCEIASLKDLRKAERAYGLGNEKAFEKIMEAFRVNEHFSKEAALALGRIGRKEAVPHLVEALNDNLSTAPEALRALGMIKDPRSVPSLLRIIKEERTYAPEAILLLGEMGDERALPLLIKMVEKESNNYIYAIQALGKIGDKRAIPILMKNLRYQEPKDQPDIQFKIVTRGESTAILDKRERILSLSQPSAHVNNINVDPSKLVDIDFSVFDFDLDTLDMFIEYSKNLGSTWKPATIEGNTKNLSVDDYDGNLIWKANIDIPAYNLNKVLLRFQPTDIEDDPYRGVPDIVHIKVDTTSLGLADVEGEYSGEIPFRIFTPAIPGIESSQLYYHYTFNNGRIWFPARIREERYLLDTLNVSWLSTRDLDEQDIDSVIFRVSTSGASVIGREVRTNPIRVDNNLPPKALIQSIRITEGDLILLDYKLEDREMDKLDLNVEYSKNGGISWLRATVDENLNQIDSSRYVSTITWNSNFDIPIPGNDKIRIRILPKDNDFGIPGTTEDFSLSKIQLAKVQPTGKRGELTVQYNSPEDRSDEKLFFDGYYSVDGGKTWRFANTLGRMRADGDKGNRYNMDWAIDTDVLDYQKRIGSVLEALMEMKTKEMIPDLILLALKRNSSKRSDKEKAVEALKLLQGKPPWVIEGLLDALIDPNPVIHSQAVYYLQDVDIPRIKMALADYQNYWNQLARNEQELYSSDKEWDYQKILETQSFYRTPTVKEMEDFLTWKGMTPKKAKNFLSNIENLKLLLKIREDFESKKISYEEYKRQYTEILKERDK